MRARVEIEYIRDRIADNVKLGMGGVREIEFIGPRPISCFEFYAKVGQRMINLLGTRMPSGILYQVDMRFRPSGRSGLLVS